VGYGQVLVKIAEVYGVKVADIVAWNSGITPDAIYAGQRLLVKLASTKTPPGFTAPTASPTISPSPTPTLSPTATSVPPSATPLPSQTAPLPAAPTPTPLPDPAAAPPFTAIAIMAALACGALGIIWVSLRRR
jgi:hypothetical protein